MREILDVFPDGLRVDTPRRLGAWKDCATQVEFLMSDGSEADISFCLSCAHELRPEHYQAVWETCIDLGDLSFRHLGRSDNERRAMLAAQMKIWPLAVLRKRRVALDLPGGMMIDRR